MPSRLDGPPKVTGHAKYGADHNLPGMVHGSIVVSTIAHGEIRAVDGTAALGAPGVLDVYSPFRPLDLRTPNAILGETWVPLQDREVAYYGQPIGLVVAETYEQARDAAMTIEVSYHERPALTSLPDGVSAAEDAPPGSDGPVTMDILAPGVVSIGDALRSSPVVVEATYSTATQNHAAMEPHSAVAAWDSGGLTVYSGNQGSHLQAMELAAALEVDVSSVHAVNLFVGGAFGGKARTSAAAFLAAAAARAIGRPVKVVLSREQVFTATAGRAATIQKVALGAAADGSLIAIRHDAWSATPMDRSFVEPASHSTRESYTAQNLSVSQKMVPLNIPKTAWMRAPGEAPGSFALESAMDELAVALNMDPIRLRLRNDSTAPLGEDLLWSGKHLDECLRVGAARFGWAGRTPHGRTDGDWLVGLGVAASMFSAPRFPASVRVTLRDDDTAEVATSGADPGTGLLTVLSLVGAESLDIPPARVTPLLGDSALPPGGTSVGSTGTASAGAAIMIAAGQVIEDLQGLASSPGAPFDGMEVSYADGRVLADGRAMTFGELLRAVSRSSLSAIGSSSPGQELAKHSFGSFGAQFCEVRVHQWTREARVSRMLGVFDAGRIINAKTARSQIIGGMTWGVSAALHEGLEIERSGRLANGDLAGYLLPVNADIPDVDVHFVEYPDTLYNSTGARGVGEIGTVGTAAAVANAIYNATGIRVRHIPIRIEDLLPQTDRHPSLGHKEDRHMIVDVHAHYLPTSYRPMLETLTATSGTPSAPAANSTPGARQIFAAMSDEPGMISQRIDMMDDAGVERQILSPGSLAPYAAESQLAVEAAQMLNDSYCELTNSRPGRFSSFVSLPLPHIDASLEEMRRGLDELGMVGVAFSCSVFNRSTAEEEFEPLYEEMNARGTTLFFHPCQNGICSPLINDYGFTAAAGASLEDTAIVLHLIKRNIPARYPDINIVIPHLGGLIPMQLARLDGQASTPDLLSPPSTMARSLYYDTVGWGSHAALRCACEAFGADHVVPGSDFSALLTVESYRRTFEYIKESRLSDQEIEKILYSNALALFGFDKTSPRTPVQ